MDNAFVHVELTTGDLAAAKKFYRKVFSWKLSDMAIPNSGGMVYTMIDPGSGVGGGMQGKPTPQSPIGWLAYVLVEDVRKTIAKARKEGAHIMVEYQEVPGMGALGVFIDPTGAALGIWQTFMAAPKKKVAAKKKAPAKKKAAAPKKKAAGKKSAGRKAKR